MFIYIHSQEGNIPEFYPDGINLNFKLLPLYANTSWEYSRRFKEVLKTEGEARGFQHFPADIKSVTSLLVPFSNSTNSRTKNSLNLNTSGEYSRILPSGGLKKC